METIYSQQNCYKKFCLTLTLVALPNLIGMDLVMTKPMTSVTGFITYLKFTYGSNKGVTKQGTVINDPFRLGEVDSAYTSQAVVESFKGDGSTKTFKLAWTPVVAIKSVFVDGQDKTEEATVDPKTGIVTLSTTTPENDKEVRIAYAYDNVYVPANDLPIINAEMASITLSAKARRIAIYYSNIAAYQAKNDYGIDLGTQLAAKAVGELKYEIDVEIVDLLLNTAGAPLQELTFNKALPVGVSKAQHYEGFLEIVNAANTIIYKRTKRFAPNIMLCAMDVIQILSFLNGWKASGSRDINGPYFAGTILGIRVYVSPQIEAGKFAFAVNNEKLEASVAVYAPYMA